MDQQARAAFVISQAACLQAVTAGMLEQNRLDTLAGRPPTHAPYEFEDQINRFGLGHNDVVTYLCGN